MGLPAAVSGADASGRAAAGVFSADTVQCCPLRREDRGAVAVFAQRLSALDGGVSAGAALDAGWSVRGACQGPADHCTRAGRPQRRPPLVSCGMAGIILDGRTLQSTPESGGRAGYDGYKKKNGSKVHIAVDTLGNLLALKATAASEQERAQVADLARQVQEQTDGAVEIAWGDQGYTGKKPAAAAAAHEIELVVVKLKEAKKGFVLLPRRWVVERTFAWLGRFRRLARDYERQFVTLEGYHWVAFVALMLGRLFTSSA